MTGYSFSTVQALSIAGSTLALGIIFGWVLALLHFGHSSRPSDRRDKED